MSESKPEHRTWWGAFSLEDDQAGRWNVGPSTIWLYRAPEEWRVIYQPGSDPMDQSVEIEVPYTGDQQPWLHEDDSEATQISRFSFRRTEPELTIQPLLADRAVVVRPALPLYIPEDETVSLFVSTPLWMRIDVGSPAKSLMSVPFFRPSDTWFGPNSMEGEMCYNTRTKARMSLDDVPLRHHRAITPIRIRNQAEDALFMERIRLPVQHLSLYASQKGFLWTELVTLERTKGDEQATLMIGEGPPLESGRSVRVSEPLEAMKSNFITRPFSMLFHKMKEA